MIYFTSDTHFSHKRICEYSKRPFASIEEHDEALIQRWNAVVKSSTDIVYHLGDFAFCPDWRAIRDRLNGRIVMIWGNHDHKSMRKKNAGLFESVHEQVLIKVSFCGMDQEIMLNHYSMRVWPKSHHGAWHLFGHSHGGLNVIQDQLGMSLDVGVDSWGYAPVSIAAIHNRMLWIDGRRKVGLATGGEHHGPPRSLPVDLA